RDGVADAAALLAAATASTAAHPGRLSSAEINRLARAIADEAGHASATDTIPALRALGLQLAGSAADEVEDQPGAISGDIAYWRRAVLDGIDNLKRPTPDVTARCDALARRATALADAMEFGFLYDRRKRIFAIGYRLGDADGPGTLDGSFYDLLASEARLASFVAIAKGD